MVTQRKRIAVTLSDESRDLVMRLAELENSSASKVIAEIVESFAPTARQVIAAAEAVQKFPEAQRAQIIAALEGMEPEVLGKLGAAQDAFTEVLKLAAGTDE